MSLTPPRVNGGTFNLLASDSSVEGMFCRGACPCRYVLGLPRSDRALVSERPIPHQLALSRPRNLGAVPSTLDGFRRPDPDGDALNLLPSGCHVRSGIATSRQPIAIARTPIAASPAADTGRLLTSASATA